MRDEDLLKCPLLQGLDATHRAELLGLLKGMALRDKVEACLTAGPNAADIPLVSYSKAKGTETPDCEKKVQKWTPANPMARRCFKE